MLWFVEPWLGQCQYRNAVASGQPGEHDFSWHYRPSTSNPTLPRYGTDRFQVRSRLTFEAEIRK
jgi:hypothetical protein